MANEVEKLNTIAIADIEKVNTLTDANIEKINTLEFASVSAGFKLYSWGESRYGVGGLGNTTAYSSPKQVGSDEDWASLHAGYYTGGGASAIKTDGTLWSWGRGLRGMLGLGNTTNYSSPVQVGSLTDWRGVIQGYQATLGFKTDGTLWSWGQGTYGALGTGSTTAVSSPVQIGSLTNWSTADWINAWSGLHGWKVIKPDGTMWVWGSGDYGTNGLGNLTNYSSPVQIGSLTTWYRGTNAGFRGNIVTKTDGTLWAWGQNSNGMLGSGNTTEYSSPIQIGSLTDWKYNNKNPRFNGSAMGGFAFVIKDDGTAWSWGGAENSGGRTGHGNETSYSSPVQIGGLTTWYQASTGYNWSAGINTSGQVFVWGNNEQGQLGLNNLTTYSSPVQLGSDTNWSTITGGRKFNMGLKTP